MRSKIYYTLFILVLSFAFAGLLLAQTNLLPNSDLETVEPGFWNKVNDGLGGAQCMWATDAAYMGLRSFKVIKPG
ncbi:MAG TPA: hypothetical protein ENK14_13400, partial [Caldithrix sp.]|nr:hypothetical protein [Caldithrix sp.]